MGCDIHVFVEVKKDDKWLLMDHPHVYRNYQLFGRIAGVRDTDIEPIVSPRGLPENLSEGTQLHWDYWNGDAHTPGWLTGKEAEHLSQHAQDFCGPKAYIHPCLFGYLFNMGLTWFPENSGISDSRVVFWFDN